MVMTDGLMTIVAGVCFYLSPIMETQLIVLAILGYGSLAILFFVMPESPDFLFTHNKIEQLEACFMKVARINQIDQREEVVPLIIKKL
jgi:hypothetical protein